jgi:hypothetical protein
MGLSFHLLTYRLKIKINVLLKYVVIKIYEEGMQNQSCYLLDAETYLLVLALMVLRESNDKKKREE